jgi:AraC-like DNA-binding protein
VAELAAQAAVSRSLLDERFRLVLGRSPIRYLTEWRMHVAEELLVSTELGVAQVARRVGYESEEAFSRAFKRSLGSSPSTWRSSGRDAGRVQDRSAHGGALLRDGARSP